MLWIIIIDRCLHIWPQFGAFFVRGDFMGKLNLRNRKGEIIKTEHKYSKGPLHYIHEGENNSAFTVIAEMCKESDPLKSLWMRYYNDVIYNDMRIHEDKSKDLYEIIRNIENESERTQFINFLIKNQYNPYEDMIDVDSGYIKKVQKFIKENYGFEQVLDINGKYVMTMYEKKDDPVLAKIYLHYIDVVILYKYSHTTVLMNDDSSDIYKKILGKEDYWVRNGKGTIHTNGKKTGLDFKSKTFLERIFA